MTWSTGLFRTTKRIKCATVHWSLPVQNSLLYFIATYLLVVVGCRRRCGWLSSTAAATAIVSRTISVFKVIAVSCNYYLNVCKWYWLVRCFFLLPRICFVLAVSVRAHKADAPFETRSAFHSDGQCVILCTSSMQYSFRRRIFVMRRVHWCVGAVLLCASLSRQQCILICDFIMQSRCVSCLWVGGRHINRMHKFNYFLSQHCAQSKMSELNWVNCYLLPLQLHRELNTRLAISCGTPAAQHSTHIIW